jgi:hypothetical protein
MIWDSFVQSRRPNRLYPLNGNIYLYVRTANVEVVFTDNDGETQYWVRISRFSHGSFRCAKLNLNWESLPSGQMPTESPQEVVKRLLKCILMGSNSTTNPSVTNIGSKAILLWIRNGERERIGIFDIGPILTVLDKEDKTFVSPGPLR